MGTYGRNRGSVLLNSHRICERRRGSWRQSSLVRAVRRRRLELTHRRVDGLTGERRWPRGRRGRGTRNSGARASGIGRAGPCLHCAKLGCRSMTFIVLDTRRCPPLTPRFVCLGVPLATRALPKGVRYLLTYLRVPSRVLRHELRAHCIRRDRHLQRRPGEI